MQVAPPARLLGFKTPAMRHLTLRESESEKGVGSPKFHCSYRELNIGRMWNTIKMAACADVLLLGVWPQYTDIKVPQMCFSLANNI